MEGISRVKSDTYIYIYIYAGVTVGKMLGRHLMGGERGIVANLAPNSKQVIWYMVYGIVMIRTREGRRGALLSGTNPTKNQVAYFIA